MIPKSAKLPLRLEFLEFRRRAARVTTPFSTIYFLQSPIPTRLAVIVSKKLSKLATTRNWLKRLTLDFLWPVLKEKKLICVVVYKPLPLKKSPETKQQVISELEMFTKTI